MLKKIFYIYPENIIHGYGVFYKYIFKFDVTECIRLGSTCHLKKKKIGYLFKTINREHDNHNELAV